MVLIGVGWSFSRYQNTGEMSKDCRPSDQKSAVLVMVTQLRVFYLVSLLLASYVQTTPRPEKMKVSKVQRELSRAEHSHLCPFGLGRASL